MAETLSTASIHDLMDYRSNVDAANCSLSLLGQRDQFGPFFLESNDIRQMNIIGHTAVLVIDVLYQSANLGYQPMEALWIKLIENFNRFLIVKIHFRVTQEISEEKDPEVVFRQVMEQTRAEWINAGGNLELVEKTYLESRYLYDDISEYFTQVILWFRGLGYVPSLGYLLEQLLGELDEYKEALELIKSGDAVQEHYKSLQLELADIFNYLIIISHVLSIDFIEAIRHELVPPGSINL